MPDINIKKQRYADKENLKKLMKYSKDTFANKSEINENYYTKEQIDTMLESGSGGTGGSGTGGDYYTKSEVDTKLISKANTGDLATVATTGSYNDLLDKPTLSNYYTKPEIDGLLSYIGGVNSVYGGMSITADESEGANDVTGGLSFFNATERAPGYDGTSQITIAEDADTVEDE